MLKIGMVNIHVKKWVMIDNPHKIGRVMLMRYSKRVESVSLSGIRKMFELAGENTISLGIGEPDFDTPLHIREAAKKALEEGLTHYTVNKGIPELRESISRKLHEDNSIEADPESIIVTVGASEALFMCMQALVDEGDHVLVPDPGFLSYAACVKLSGGIPVPIKLEERTEFRTTPEAVLESLTDKTKAIVLNSPSNPTGGIMSKEDVKGLAEIADDHNIVLISDEIYEKIIYDNKHHSPGSYSENVVTINGFSKAYAMTGFRVGYTAASPELTEELLKVHQYTTACATSISQSAALAALEGPQDRVGEMVGEFRNRRDLLLKRLKELGIDCPTPKGAFYAFPEVPESEKFVEETLKRDVITVHGSSFGEYGRDNVRLSYATSQENINKAMDRLEDLKIG